jgi:hypothetical protein
MLEITNGVSGNVKALAILRLINTYSSDMESVLMKANDNLIILQKKFNLYDYAKKDQSL